MKVDARKGMKKLEGNRPYYPECVYVWPEPSDPRNNTYAMAGEVMRLMRKAGVDPNVAALFSEQVFSGDRKHAEDMIRKWVTCVRVAGYERLDDEDESH
jgi:hypothetical protein